MGHHRRNWLALQQECRKVYVDPSMIQYAVKLVRATRTARRKLRASPTSQQATSALAPARAPPSTLIEGARALACCAGAAYVLPEDMTDLVADVLRHRLVLSYERCLRAWTPTSSDPGKVMAKISPPPG